MSMKDQCAIVGVGLTPYGKRGEFFEIPQVEQIRGALHKALDESGRKALNDIMNLAEQTGEFGMASVDQATADKLMIPTQKSAKAFKEKYQVWIANWEYKGQNLVFALSTVCTHLGCTPNWLAGENKFKCPCHGSGFYPTGINFEGPAPRPLERHKIALADDGQILVDKNVKYQQEKGQWEDPSSFLLYTG